MSAQRGRNPRRRSVGRRPAASPSGRVPPTLLDALQTVEKYVVKRVKDYAAVKEGGDELVDLPKPLFASVQNALQTILLNQHKADPWTLVAAYANTVLPAFEFAVSDLTLAGLVQRWGSLSASGVLSHLARVDALHAEWFQELVPKPANAAEAGAIPSSSKQQQQQQQQQRMSRPAPGASTSQLSPNPAFASLSPYSPYSSYSPYSPYQTQPGAMASSYQPPYYSPASRLSPYSPYASSPYSPYPQPAPGMLGAPPGYYNTPPPPGSVYGGYGQPPPGGIIGPGAVGLPYDPTQGWGTVGSYGTHPMQQQQQHPYSHAHPQGPSQSGVGSEGDAWSNELKATAATATSTSTLHALASSTPALQSSSSTSSSPSSSSSFDVSAPPPPPPPPPRPKHVPPPYSLTLSDLDGLARVLSSAIVAASTSSTPPPSSSISSSTSSSSQGTRAVSRSPLRTLSRITTRAAATSSAMLLALHSAHFTTPVIAPVTLTSSSSQPSSSSPSPSLMVLSSTMYYHADASTFSSPFSLVNSSLPLTQPSRASKSTQVGQTGQAVTPTGDKTATGPSQTLTNTPSSSTSASHSSSSSTTATATAAERLAVLARQFEGPVTTSSNVTPSVTSATSSASPQQQQQYQPQPLPSSHAPSYPSLVLTGVILSLAAASLVPPKLANPPRLLSYAKGLPFEDEAGKTTARTSKSTSTQENIEVSTSSSSLESTPTQASLGLCSVQLPITQVSDANDLHTVTAATALASLLYLTHPLVAVTPVNVPALRSALLQPPLQEQLEQQQQQQQQQQRQQQEPLHQEVTMLLSDYVVNSPRIPELIMSVTRHLHLPNASTQDLLSWTAVCSRLFKSYISQLDVTPSVTPSVTLAPSSAVFIFDATIADEVLLDTPAILPEAVHLPLHPQRTPVSSAAPAAAVAVASSVTPVTPAPSSAVMQPGAAAPVSFPPPLSTLESLRLFYTMVTGLVQRLPKPTTTMSSSMPSSSTSSSSFSTSSSHLGGGVALELALPPDVCDIPVVTDGKLPLSHALLTDIIRVTGISPTMMAGMGGSAASVTPNVTPNVTAESTAEQASTSSSSPSPPQATFLKSLAAILGYENAMLVALHRIAAGISGPYIATAVPIATCRIATAFALKGIVDAVLPPACLIELHKISASPTTSTSRASPSTSSSISSVTTAPTSQLPVSFTIACPDSSASLRYHEAVIAQTVASFRDVTFDLSQSLTQQHQRDNSQRTRPCDFFAHTRALRSVTVLAYSAAKYLLDCSAATELALRDICDSLSLAWLYPLVHKAQAAEVALCLARSEREAADVASLFSFVTSTGTATSSTLSTTTMAMRQRDNLAGLVKSRRNALVTAALRTMGSDPQWNITSRTKVLATYLNYSISSPTSSSAFPSSSSSSSSPSPSTTTFASVRSEALVRLWRAARAFNTLWRAVNTQNSSNDSGDASSGGDGKVNGNSSRKKGAVWKDEIGEIIEINGSAFISQPTPASRLSSTDGTLPAFTPPPLFSAAGYVAFSRLIAFLVWPGGLTATPPSSSTASSATSPSVGGPDKTAVSAASSLQALQSAQAQAQMAQLQAFVDEAVDTIMQDKHNIIHDPVSFALVTDALAHLEFAKKPSHVTTVLAAALVACLDPSTSSSTSTAATPSTSLSSSSSSFPKQHNLPISTVRAMLLLKLLAPEHSLCSPITATATTPSSIASSPQNSSSLADQGLFRCSDVPSTIALHAPFSKAASRAAATTASPTPSSVFDLPTSLCDAVTVCNAPVTDAYFALWRMSRVVGSSSSTAPASPFSSRTASSSPSCPSMSLSLSPYQTALEHGLASMALDLAPRSLTGQALARAHPPALTSATHNALESTGSHSLSDYFWPCSSVWSSPSPLIAADASSSSLAALPRRGLPLPMAVSAHGLHYIMRAQRARASNPRANLHTGSDVSDADISNSKSRQSTEAAGAASGTVDAGMLSTSPLCKDLVAQTKMFFLLGLLRVLLVSTHLPLSSLYAVCLPLAHLTYLSPPPLLAQRGSATLAHVVASIYTRVVRILRAVQAVKASTTTPTATTTTTGTSTSLSAPTRDRVLEILTRSATTNSSPLPSAVSSVSSKALSTPTPAHAPIPHQIAQWDLAFLASLSAPQSPSSTSSSSLSDASAWTSSSSSSTSSLALVSEDGLVSFLQQFRGYLSLSLELMLSQYPVTATIGAVMPMVMGVTALLPEHDPLLLTLFAILSSRACQLLDRISPSSVDRALDTARSELAQLASLAASVDKIFNPTVTAATSPSSTGVSEAGRANGNIPTPSPTDANQLVGRAVSALLTSATAPSPPSTSSPHPTEIAPSSSSSSSSILSRVAGLQETASSSLQLQLITQVVGHVSALLQLAVTLLQRMDVAFMPQALELLTDVIRAAPASLAIVQSDKKRSSASSSLLSPESLSPREERLLANIPASGANVNNPSTSMSTSTSTSTSTSLPDADGHVLLTVRQAAALLKGQKLRVVGVRESLLTDIVKAVMGPFDLYRKDSVVKWVFTTARSLGVATQPLAYVPESETM